MRHVISITINELKVNFGNPVSLIMLIALPVVFTVVLGLALGAGSGRPTIRVDAIDLDGSELSARLINTLREVSGDTLTICVLTEPAAQQPEACNLPAEIELEPDAPTARRRIEENVTYAAVIIPEGFGARLLAGDDVRVIYRTNAAFTTPMFIRQTVDAAITRASGSVVAARLSADAAQRVGVLDESQRVAFFNDVYRAAETAWQRPPAVLAVEATVHEERGTAVGFSQSAPGMATMFVMVNVLGVAQSLVASRNNWTFQRLMVMPVPRWAIVAGKLAAYYLAGLCAFLIILGVGGLVGVNYGDSPLAVLAVAAVYTLTVSAMGLALATFTRTLAQASVIGTLAAVVLAPLGGAWWPLDIVPQTMNVAGHIISPIAWAMDAFNGMIYYGKGLADILPYLGVLLLYTVVFFVIGVWRFRYE